MKESVKMNALGVALGVSLGMLPTGQALANEGGTYRCGQNGTSNCSPSTMASGHIQDYEIDSGLTSRFIENTNSFPMIGDDMLVCSNNMADCRWATATSEGWSFL